MAISKKNNSPVRGSDQTESRAIGNGRRAYVRYPVILDATIVAGQDRNIPCAMRDFCMGGMLLHFKNLLTNGQPTSVAAQDVVTVRCTVPDPDGDRLVEFRAHVARTMQDGVGISFINPDPECLQVMQQFALQYSQDAENSHAQKVSELKRARDNSGSLGRRYSDIISGCGRIAEETMNSLLEQIGSKLENRLFDLARDTTDLQKQNDFLSASDEMKASHAQFIRTIQSNFQERLQERTVNIVDRKQPNKQQVEEVSLEDMTLIGDEDLGAWLAISEVTNKVEERNKESLTNLEERLSIVFDTKISHVNNPYAPDIFAESFQAGLGPYKFKEDVNVACYAVIKDVFIPTLSGLYDKLNGTLTEYGILPKLKHKPFSRSTSSSSADDPSDPAQTSDSPSPHQRQAKDANTFVGDEVVNLSQTSELTPPDQTRSSAIELPRTEHNTIPVDSNDLNSPQPKSTRPKIKRKGGASPEPPPDLYQLVQDLRELRQQYSSSASFAPTESQVNSQDVSVQHDTQLQVSIPPTFYSTSELIDVVADLQVCDQPIHNDSTQVTPIKSRVLTALKERSGNDGGKGINSRDSNVLEVAGDFLSAVQSDPLVAGSVKPWLKQLELPVLKLALKDPTLFFDQSHVARQVVNSIAQLEFYQQDNIQTGQNSISGAIENLLEKIALERSDGVEIFSEIQTKLNNLIKIQNMAYAENVKDVVKACQDNFPIPEVYEFEAITGYDMSDAEMHKWAIFARRLREGDDVIFASLDSMPQRLRVAWIDDKQTLYVFVNLRGIKEKVLNVSDVARMICVGIIEPQGNAADPAMDRAQYSIMQNLYKQVVHESTHDNLTGLINRREFVRRLDDAVTDAKRNDKRLALMLIDIDQFSAINRNCGYGGGDKLLQDVMEILRKDMDDKGLIARVGADEFALLTSEVSLDDALAIAESKIDDVANHRLEWEGNSFKVSLSIGVVPVSTRSGNVDELMQAAESSCRAARESGGNRLQVFHAGYAKVEHQAEIMKWAANVDKMIEGERLQIRCQRIEPIDQDGPLSPHYEILLGVKDEQGNVGSPVEFIKGAEMSRKMSEVDRYVVTKAFAWMNDNAKIFDKIAGFTINLSGESLNEQGFVEFILERLQGVSVPYENICFEITETVGITSLSDAALGIDRIKDTGCRFALDDFGSGMSSYGYLKNLPVDLVKIDGVFVKELVADSSDYAVVKSITEIAHFMKKKVVAEFVENSETLELLREIGVDYAQGYMIDKPGSLDRLLNM